MRSFNKFSKGQVEALTGIVLGAVLLFVGLFMISTISSATPESTLKDYGYTTVTNSTALTLNGSVNQTQNLAIGTLVSISGETSDKTLVIKANNTHATDTFNLKVYLNGNLKATETLPNNTVTTLTYTDVNWVASATNNVTLNSNTTSSDVEIISSVGKYPSSKADSNWGSINTSIISTIGTVFSVLGLVLIVIALAVAIGVINSSMIGGKPVA